MNEPGEPISASNDVTSAEISFSGVWVSVLETEIFTFVPILTFDFSTKMRFGSRNRSMNESGSRRLEST